MSAHTTATQYRDMLESALENTADATSALYVSAPKEFVMVGDSVRTIAVLTPHEATQLAAELLRSAAAIMARPPYADADQLDREQRWRGGWDL